MVMLSTPVSELDLDIAAGQLTQTIVLHNISWSTYKAILAEMGEQPSLRVAYTHETLIIKMPSKLHEVINRLLARIVAVLTEELDLEIVDVGSTTLEKEVLEKGAEPDTGFYIQNADKVEVLAAKLPDDLPPDLVLEVDITNSSVQKTDIYQALGVAEVWRYTSANGLSIYHLRSDGYYAADFSKAFPFLSATKLNEFVLEHRTKGVNQVIRDVRSWVQALDA